MGKARQAANKPVKLDHVIYREPTHLGAELDDFEHCYGEWIRKAYEYPHVTDGLLGAMSDNAVKGVDGMATVVLLDHETARFVAFFIAYVDQCGGEPVLRVPVCNWVRRIDDATEDAVLQEIDRYACAHNCTGYLIHGLTFQKRLRRAVTRALGSERSWVAKVGGK